MLATYEAATDRYRCEEIDLHPADASTRQIDLCAPESLIADIAAARAVSLDLHAGGHLRLQTASSEILLAFESPASRNWFVEAHISRLMDLTAVCDDAGSGDAFLWLLADVEHLWLLNVARRNNKWAGVVLKRKRINLADSVTMKAFMRRPTDENARNVIYLLVDMESGLELPKSLPLFAELATWARSTPPRLTIKLEPGCEWFLFVPLDHVSVDGRANEVSWAVEWVVTAKSLTRNHLERKQMVHELSELRTLLRHTVLVINTYPHFEERWLEATGRVRALLRYLCDVEIQVGREFETHSLRVLVNPAAAEIEQMLRDPNTWYVFAAFHVESGVWQLGGDGGRFPLDQFEKGSLAHIRLMRVYHCNSLFDPANPMAIHDSIAGVLLRAGAARAEGSAFVENFPAFLRAVVGFVAEHPSLRLVLEQQLACEGSDLSQLLSQIEISIGTFRRGR